MTRTPSTGPRTQAEITAEARANLEAGPPRPAPCSSSVWPELRPNGTIGCGDPEHHIGQPVPDGLTVKERVKWSVDHFPPLTEDQRRQLALILHGHDVAEPAAGHAAI
jgi:hypothetical protein